jgi:hypothetical protein
MHHLGAGVNDGQTGSERIVSFLPFHEEQQFHPCRSRGRAICMIKYPRRLTSLRMFPDLKQKKVFLVLA